MASIDDVQNAIKSVIVEAVYPNNMSNPSIVGNTVYVAVGNFLKQNLDDGLSNNITLNDRKVFVEILGLPGMTRNTTGKFRRDEIVTGIDDPTLTLTKLNNTVTVGGTVTEGQVCMIRVNRVGYAYSATFSDTLNSIAANLAALIPNASALANVITIAGTPHISVHISVQGLAIRILQSQESLIRVRIIAPTHALRAAIGDAIQIAILNQDYYIEMPDRTMTSIKAAASPLDDNRYELPLAFVRDYKYLVEYHTAEVRTYQQIADAETTVSTSH